MRLLPRSWMLSVLCRCAEQAVAQVAWYLPQPSGYIPGPAQTIQRAVELDCVHNTNDNREQQTNVSRITWWMTAAGPLPWPSDDAEPRDMPGIGEYTAETMMHISYGMHIQYRWDHTGRAVPEW